MGVLFSGANAAQAAPPVNAPTVAEPASAVDEMPNPAEDERRDARQTALRAVLNGTATIENRGGS
jgi:immune inhibitor A